MNSIALIRELASAFGPPGFEDDVLKIAKKYIPSKYNFEIDSMLNLTMNNTTNKPELPTILIDAHLDEVGLMVHSINENGTIAFTTLGEWVPNVLTAQKVVIKNLDNDFIIGVVSTKPPHYAHLKDEELKIQSLSIDIGASSKEEVQNYYKISPACPIVPHSEFEYFDDTNIMMSKAFDCRLGCAAVLETLDIIKDLALNVNIVGALSSQEEVGMRGAKVLASRIKPDIAIVFEGSPADDSFAASSQIQTRLKKGPMLRHIDNSMIANPRFMRFAIDIAKKNNIDLQEAVRLGGFTNAMAYSLSESATPTIVIGHPVRYAHSGNSIASLDDYKKGVALAVEIIKALNSNIISSF